MEQTTVVLQANGSEALSVVGSRLVVLRGPDKGRALRIEKDEVIVGTSSSADLVLTDPTVSRNHIVLKTSVAGQLVEDLGSTNGTRFGGRRIQAIFVEHGDTLDLGATRIRIEPHKTRLELPLSAQERFGRLIGRSVAMRRMFAQLEEVASANITVMLTGETGSGKDSAAEAIHEASARASGPFVIVDCGSIVPTLFESEVFGHEKGAFTGADTSRVGAFAEADGGTLFLDEVGELPREVQSKLLRGLERQEIRPVGGSQHRKVSVRILASTSRDLKLEVNRGAFREDLFYRLSVVTIRVPSLRERPDDVLLLAQHFWREASRDPEATLPERVAENFRLHSWPGNVRELKNRVERAVLSEGGHEITAVGAKDQESFGTAKGRAVEEFERAFLSGLIARAGGNVSEASRLASMDRVYLSKLLRRYGLQPKRLPSADDPAK